MEHALEGFCFCAAAGWLDIAMVATLCILLLAGFPAAFSLAGVAILYALIALSFGVFDLSFVKPLPQRIFGAVSNTTLIAVPMFILMGVILEKAKIAEELLDEMAKLFGSLPGGLGISVTIVGALLAASTGIVGATVVTMGLLSLPTMLRRGYDPAFASGSIAAAGTLGQIIHRRLSSYFLEMSFPMHTKKHNSNREYLLQRRSRLVICLQVRSFPA